VTCGYEAPAVALRAYRPGVSRVTWKAKRGAIGDICSQISNARAIFFARASTTDSSREARGHLGVFFGKKSAVASDDDGDVY